VWAASNADCPGWVGLVKHSPAGSAIKPFVGGGERCARVASLSADWGVGMSRQERHQQLDASCPALTIHTKPLDWKNTGARARAGTQVAPYPRRYYQYNKLDALLDETPPLDPVELKEQWMRKRGNFARCAAICPHEASSAAGIDAAGRITSELSERPTNIRCADWPVQPTDRR